MNGNDGIVVRREFFVDLNEIVNARLLDFYRVATFKRFAVKQLSVNVDMIVVMNRIINDHLERHFTNVVLIKKVLG